MSFEIRDATAADAAGIRRLFELVFGSALTEEEWSWKFASNPDGWYGVVGVHEGRIVGHYAGWGMRFLLDGSPALLYSVGDVATDPSVRALGGRRSVYREMTDVFYARVRGEGVPFCFGFPNARALRVSERIVGSRTLFPVRLKEVPVEAFAAPPTDLEAGDFPPERFDPLWEAARRGLTHAAMRDRGRVNWRFHGRPSRYYRMVWRGREGPLSGWAVLSVTGEIATVVDFLGAEPDGGDLSGLFDGAASEARRLGARRVVFWMSPGGPGRRILEALPAPPREAGFPIIVRAFDDAAADRFAQRVHLVPSLYDLS